MKITSKTSAVAMLITLGIILLLNFTRSYTIIMLGHGSPPFTNLPPNELVHYWTGEARQGWPFVALASYSVEGKEYVSFDESAVAKDVLWGVILVVSSGAAGWAAAFYVTTRARYRRDRGLCATCGYNLKANLSGICPECGKTVAATDRYR